jgi:hypothetical protein
MDLTQALQRDESSAVLEAARANPRNAWMQYLAKQAERGLLAVQMQAELALAAVRAERMSLAPGSTPGSMLSHCTELHML